MSLSGLILGVINAAIVVAILLLVGAIILWFCNWMSISVPDMVRKLYIAVVALIGLYLIVALLLGIPSVHIIGRVELPPEPGIQLTLYRVTVDSGYYDFTNLDDAERFANLSKEAKIQPLQVKVG